MTARGHGRRIVEVSSVLEGSKRPLWRISLAPRAVFHADCSPEVGRSYMSLDLELAQDPESERLTDCRCGQRFLLFYLPRG
jgi:hypothetical protein